MKIREKCKTKRGKSGKYLEGCYALVLANVSPIITVIRHVGARNMTSKWRPSKFVLRVLEKDKMLVVLERGVDEWSKACC